MANDKLYPPYIEGKIPAQIGNTLRIPYQHNRAVGAFDSLNLKIKTVSTGLEKGIIAGGKAENNVAVFNNGIGLQIGQYYKAQLAYVSGAVVGYYSTAGIFKYTGEPTVTIQGFETESINTYGSEIIGVYQAPEGDPNEKAYYYCFNLYEEDELLASTGEQLHNSSEDDKNATESYDSYKLNHVLSFGKTYTIEYIVTTSNGLRVSSPRYYINSNSEQIPISLNGKLKAENNYDNGYIDIKLIFENLGDNIQGQFRLLRYSDTDNYATQEVLQEFIIDDIVTESEFYLFKDLTAQQGINYKYAIQQYNNSLYSEKIISNIVMSDFEDIFLYDGERQLKVRYNPKVSSFKNTILESKLDTIGGQFPFVFRNGNTKYKEFPISGLISYQLDDSQMFIREKDIASGLYEYNFRTNLTSDNISMEREFKLQVLEWLNNGEPKLFRSPTEGNYIVRIMNVSLSPNDTLGRMIHTFNSTAYEIASYSYENLIKYGFVSNDINSLIIERLYSINLEPNKTYHIDNAIWARIVNAENNIFSLTFADNKSVERKVGEITGYYNIHIMKDNPLISIQTGEQVAETAKIEYITKGKSSYDLYYNDQVVEKVEIIEKGAQFKGAQLEDGDIISQIIANEKSEGITVHNILFLRLEALPPDFTSDNGDYSVTIDGVDLNLAPNTIYVSNPNPIVGNSLDEVWKRVINGRIELTAADFDGHFAPSSIVIGKDVRADIYYQLNKMTFRKDEVEANEV